MKLKYRPPYAILVNGPYWFLIPKKGWKPVEYNPSGYVGSSNGSYPMDSDDKRRDYLTRKRFTSIYAKLGYARYSDWIPAFEIKQSQIANGRIVTLIRSQVST